MTAPDWAWWGEGPGPVPLAHAVRVIQQGARFEEAVLAGDRTGPPLDRALQAYQREHRAMGRNDRLLLGAAVFGLARNRDAIRRALPGAEPGRGSHLLLALLDGLAVEPERVPGLPGGPEPWRRAAQALADVRAEGVRVAQRTRSTPLNALSASARSNLAALFSVPDWWFENGPWDTVGQATEELARLKRPQQLCLRAQAHRGNRESAVAALSALGIPVRSTLRSPWGVLVEGRHNVLGTDVVRRGVVEVQDEGSQLVACLCDPRPNERILDLCAGGGGKTLALASMMGGRGLVIAHDAATARLADTRLRARRAGLGNVRVVAGADEVERLGPYDLVLVDAPCSSSGTLRRNPDVAWRWPRDSVVQLTDTQARILDHAAGLVAPGKTLVYVTCSLLPAENGRQIEAFLGRHPEFDFFPLGDRRSHGPLLDVSGADRGAFRLPADLARYSGDAFFLARLRRRR
ncbi:MAG: RsmB/NOP family class I SAM-dependent RNA methyltransferase [Deltaproteobacteria bacterium]|nr:RsmB/NOP family class I SAM-dependent RNA methyltransferase [Deltaproteobacteria bacterium]